MREIFLNIISFTGGLAVMAGTGQIFVMNKRRENWNLTSLFCTLGILLLQVSAVLAGNEGMKWVPLYHTTLLFCLGPLLLLAYNAVVYPEKPFPAWAGFLFIPALASLLAESVFLLTGGAGRSYLFDIMYKVPLDRSARIMLVFLVLACIQDVLYIIRFLAGILPLAHVSWGNAIVNFTVIFATGSLSGTLFLCAGYLTANGNFIMAAGLITSCCLMGTYFMGQRYPHYLHIFKVQVKERKYRKSLLSSYNVDDICRRLNLLMENDKLYRDDNLSLKSLADALDINPHQLSELLNDTLKTNFYTYINSFRIAEAAGLLLADKKRPVLSIAYEVGFNTKSSFYDAFSRYTGKTPQQYRRENGR